MRAFYPRLPVTKAGRTYLSIAGDLRTLIPTEEIRRAQSRLDNLPEGHYRPLTSHEIDRLMSVMRNDSDMHQVGWLVLLSCWHTDEVWRHVNSEEPAVGAHEYRCPVCDQEDRLIVAWQLKETQVWRG